ncbi:putative glucose transporter [Trypanosoma grayi]|uniref:putative glucose transporter n=1 Tax=Trypanosoma grayi TaxID=71804 RepID=UPI0004F410FC|nr:putative glucose transporter [Trypanosoma grayi]KEG12342.1 putative glucose transporter [Trypanosoma grayi]
MEQHSVKRRTVTPQSEDQEGLLIDKKTKPVATAYCVDVPFFSWEVLQIVLLHVIAGSFLGYSVGFVGPYYTFVKISRDCSAITAQAACLLSIPGRCEWENNSCIFRRDTCRGLALEDCGVDFSRRAHHCLWETKASLCTRQVGYTAVQNGFFAAAMIAGGCLGSLCAGVILSATGRRKTFFYSGLVACVAAVLTHVSTYTDQYVMVIAGRVLAGVASGVLCVASPLYVEEMAPAQHRQLVGVFFQVACTFGILLAATMGLVLNPRDFSTDLHMQLCRQGLCIPPSIIAVCVVISGLYMKESPQWVEQRLRARAVREERASVNDTLNVPVDDDDNMSDMHPGSDTMKYSWRLLVRPLTTSFVMCVAQQMTGINAIMNYAPNITSVMGLAPLTGNFVIMAWNFAVVLVSIPLSSKYRADFMYIGAVFVTSTSCLLTGIFVFPPMGAGDTLKRVFSSIGIAIFIAFFEIGMGSFFWALSHGIFPPAFRARGSSFTVLVQFLFNILINVGFPIAVERLSGGPSGNQDKGMGIAFMFFASIGFITGVYLLKYLRLWEAQ